MGQNILRLGVLLLLALAIAVPRLSLDARAAASPFPDVPAGASYAEAIQQLSARGVIRGYPDGRFGPKDVLLRAQTAVTLVRAMGLADQPVGRDFSDRGATDLETWTAVRILAGRDIAHGFPDGTFLPAGALTRQQAISLVSRTMVALGFWVPQPATTRFSDVAPDHQSDIDTYSAYVGAIPQTMVPQNTESGILGADASATRGWYAEVLWAALVQVEARPRPAATPTASATALPSQGQIATATAMVGTPTAYAPLPPSPTASLPATPRGSPTPAPQSAATPIATQSPIVTPSSGYLRGVNLSGGEFGVGTLPERYDQDYTYPTPVELDYYSGVGMTLVRLPFLWERLQPGLFGPLDLSEVARIDAVFDNARSRGLKVILDPHNYARYRGQVIGTDAVPNASFADFWAKLAAHYQAEPALYAYGLMNEPHDTAGRWPAAAQAGVDGIRSSDHAHAILVPGEAWSGAWHWNDANANLAIVDPVGNMLYEAHQYFDRDGSGTYGSSYDADGAYPTIGVDRLKPFLDWLKAHNARGFLGEYGVPDNDPRWLAVLDNFLGTLDTAGIGGTYWAGGPWWGDYPLSIEPRAGQGRPQMPILVQHLSR